MLVVLFQEAPDPVHFDVQGVETIQSQGGSQVVAKLLDGDQRKIRGDADLDGLGQAIYIDHRLAAEECPAEFGSLLGHRLDSFERYFCG